MCSPPGRPAHPSRLESYFKWTASKEGEGLLWRGGGGGGGGRGGDYFPWVSYSRGQISGRSSRREAGRGREVRGGGVGGVGTDGLFTKGSGATGVLYISSVSCPDFPHLQERTEGRRGLGSRC